ncbi:CPBP family intramembrane glutamic endopeptidase [Halovivax cerinus]|uniref:CPBP family intramembrane glutamic endopeptidase n=1 Tax=Halovivax cerinus TaxID=1487865 RepID=A0ABD5NM79_9EURY|nr:CPBP family intramembrane glutamic endopeptidase [Halovivax cerinus]
MVRWVAFAVIVTLLTTVMVWLSLLTQRSITPIESTRSDETTLSTAVDSRAMVGRDDGEAWTGRDDGDDRSDHEDGAAWVDQAANIEPADRDGERGRSGDHDTDGGSSADSPAVETTAAEVRDGVRSGATVRSSAGEWTDRATSATQSSPDRIVARARGVPITSRGLLLNALATQGLFLALVAGAIVLTGVPADALGIALSHDAIVPDLGLGLGAGLGLYAASEGGSRLIRRLGVDHDEWLRESLAPARRRDWFLLFGVVLPVIAIFEELLFRGVLIGAFATGFGISPWLLAIGSSVLFAIGHGIQGRAGIVVTGVIGFALAGLFVLSESLVAVVTAHYLLNAFEFAVHEGFGLDR